jgi:hypothetical protein
MNTSYHGAILLLNSTPDDDTTDNIAKDVAEEHFPEYSYRYRLTNELPDGTPVDLADQYSASLRDLPKGATYLLVYPVEESQSNT